MQPQKYIVTVFKNRTEWRNEEGLLHRLDGPAVEYASGTKCWYVNDKLHRLDGPAIEWKNGNKEWWVNGKRHRLDGPAIEWKHGNKEWLVNGKFHRLNLNGPAIECVDGDKEWWIEGKFYTEKQFNEKVKQLQNTPCEGKIVEIDGVKYKLTSV
jgi:hypothetical protein